MAIDFLLDSMSNRESTAIPYKATGMPDKNQKKYRRLKNLNIKFISFCKKGANQIPVIYKEDSDILQFASVEVSKEQVEKGEILGVVYAPNKVDAHGDFADSKAIEEAAYSFMKQGAELDIMHNGKPVEKDKAYVAQSFIIQKDDPRFSDDLSSAWGVVIKLEDPDLKEKYKNGEWSGISMGGTGNAEFADPPVTKNVDTENPMDLKELLTLLKSLEGTSGGPSAKDIAAEVAKALQPKNQEPSLKDTIKEVLKELGIDKKPAVKKTSVYEFDEDGMPVFTGDPNNKIHLKKFHAALVKYEKGETINPSEMSADELAAHIAEVEKSEKSSVRKGVSSNSEMDVEKIAEKDFEAMFGSAENK